MNPVEETVVEKPNKLRVIAISIGLLIALPLGSFFFFNGQNYFARASDELPRDVIVSDITKSTASIVWTTDKDTQAVIEYGLSPDELSLFSPELSAKKDHSADLTLLTPSTTYYFQMRVGGVVYDNAGVPWTFTTHTITGEDARDRVKGVNTQVTPRITKDPDKDSSDSADLSTSNCKATSCEEIKALFGRGCSSRDYIQCISGNKTSTPSAGTTIVYSTPYPTPTSVHIVSNLCKMQYLQSVNNCSNWRWDSLQKKPAICQEAFDRYIFECRNASFSSSSGDYKRLQGEAFTSIATTSASLWETPSSGTMVYCRVRAVDAEGSDDGDSHGTSWVYAEKKCD